MFHTSIPSQKCIANVFMLFFFYCVIIRRWIMVFEKRHHHLQDPTLAACILVVNLLQSFWRVEAKSCQ